MHNPSHDGLRILPLSLWLSVLGVLGELEPEKLLDERGESILLFHLRSHRRGGFHH